MDTNIKAASIQMACVPGDVPINIEKATSLISEAKELGAELVVLPELFNVGYDLDLLKGLDYDSKDTIAALSETAKRLGVYIAGGIAETANDGMYNSVVVINSLGELEVIYRKINLFCLSKEKQIFKPGNKPVTFSIRNINFGIMICYDIRFPELARKYIDLDCTALIVSSAFPFPRLDHWRILLKARAIENQLYLIASNRVGKDQDYSFLGNSCIIDPWGTVKSTINETDEGIVLHTVSSGNVAQVREFMPCLKDRTLLG